MSNKCSICRFPCKVDNPEPGCKFIPQNHLLGYPIHFKDAHTKRNNKHEETSRICVVCKDYFHHEKIRWLKLPSGYYSFCPSDASRATFIAKYVPKG